MENQTSYVHDPQLSVWLLTLLCKKAKVCLHFQGKLYWSKPEHNQVAEGAPCLEAFEDHQEGAQAQGCVRLRRQFTKKCVQHPHRLHPFPGK